MREKIRYNCKDNDNFLLLVFDGAKLSEIHAVDSTKENCVVISADDLARAVDAAMILQGKAK